MPRVTTKFSFTKEELTTPEGLVTALAAFSEYVEATYAKKAISVPVVLEDAVNETISLDPATQRIRLVITTTGNSTITLVDHENNPCSVGTLVEIRIDHVGTLTVYIKSPLATTVVTDSYGSTGQRSLYYFKTTTGWTKL